MYTTQKNKHINLYDLFFSKKVSLIFKHVKYEKVYKNENVQSNVILFFIFTNKYLA